VSKASQVPLKHLLSNAIFSFGEADSTHQPKPKKAKNTTGMVLLKKSHIPAYVSALPYLHRFFGRFV
jgi:hypothetical protein